MRSSARRALLLVAVALGAGCESDQPTQGTSGNFGIEVVGTGGKVRIYDTFQLYEDLNLNGVNDGGESAGLFCRTAETGFAPSVPWFFSAKVSVIPAGQTEPIQLTSAAAAAVAANLTHYDPLSLNLSEVPDSIDVTHKKGRCHVSSSIVCNPDGEDAICGLFDPSVNNVCDERGVCSANPGIPCTVGGTECAGQGRCSLDQAVFCNPALANACQNQGLGSCITFGTCVGEIVTRRFSFASGRKMSGANREVMSAGPNSLALSCCTSWTSVGAPGVGPVECTGQVVCDGLPPGWAPGVCPGTDLGPENLDDQPLPYSFQVNTGDTVIVEMGRSANGPEIELPDPGNLPAIEAVPFLDGTLLQTGGLVGTTTAPPPEGVLSFYVIAN